MLELLDVAAGEAVMVGDTIEDDIEGARAVGMRAVLVDREGRYPERPRPARRPARAARGARPRLRVIRAWAGSSGCSLRWRSRVGELVTPGLFFLGPVALAARRRALSSPARRGHGRLD